MTTDAPTSTQDGDVPGCPFVGDTPFDPLDAKQTDRPWSWLEAAREQGPVFYDERFDVWFITHHYAAREVYRDYHRFSSKNANTLRPLTPKLREGYPTGTPSRRRSC